jgi:hypothetical protein
MASWANLLWYGASLFVVLVIATQTHVFQDLLSLPTPSTQGFFDADIYDYY